MKLAFGQYDRRNYNTNNTHTALYPKGLAILAGNEEVTFCFFFTGVKITQITHQLLCRADSITYGCMVRV